MDITEADPDLIKDNSLVLWLVNMCVYACIQNKFILTAPNHNKSFTGLWRPPEERQTRTVMEKPFKKPWKGSLKRKPPSTNGGKINGKQKHSQMFLSVGPKSS